MEKTRELSIEEQQQILFEMLKFYDEICRKEHLTYYLAYGTLLGAVREHGFIEWDDDVDVWMPREDYDKFNNTFSQYQNRKYFLQNYKTDKEFPIPEITRICVNGTYKWPEGCEGNAFHTGMFIDIFPLDFGYGDKRDLKNLKKCAFYHGVLYSKTANAKTSPISFKRRLRRLVEQMIPSVVLRKRLMSLVEKSRGNNQHVFLSLGAAYAGASRSLFDVSWFCKPVFLTFENLQFPCPEMYEELLSYMYGPNYMIPQRTKISRIKAYLMS